MTHLRRSAAILSTIVAVLGDFAVSPALGKDNKNFASDRCLSKMKIDMVAFRNCKYALEQKQASKLGRKACSAQECLYRLSRDQAGVFSGSGYRVKIKFANSMLHATLSGPNGTGRFEQSCGAGSCPGKAEWVAGAYRKAYYDSIGGDEDPSYVVLHVRR